MQLAKPPDADRQLPDQLEAAFSGSDGEVEPSQRQGSVRNGLVSRLAEVQDAGRGLRDEGEVTVVRIQIPVVTRDRHQAADGRLLKALNIHSNSLAQRPAANLRRRFAEKLSFLRITNLRLSHHESNDSVAKPRQRGIRVDVGRASRVTDAVDGVLPFVLAVQQAQVAPLGPVPRPLATVVARMIPGRGWRCTGGIVNERWKLGLGEPEATATGTT